MKEEISAAVVFLARIIEKGDKFNTDQLDHFKRQLYSIMVKRFENHWFPENPNRGQGYRCIRVNEVNRDPILVKAAYASGIAYTDMKLPTELTIWVDPNEVCCRFGESKGSFCTLASFGDANSSGVSSGSEDSVTDDSNMSTSTNSKDLGDSMFTSTTSSPSPRLSQENNESVTMSRNESTPLKPVRSSHRFNIRRPRQQTSYNNANGNAYQQQPQQHYSVNYLSNRNCGSSMNSATYPAQQNWFNLMQSQWMPGNANCGNPFQAPQPHQHQLNHHNNHRAMRQQPMMWASTNQRTSVKVLVN